MKIVESTEMADIDTRAQSEFSIPGLLLMENAGVKAYRACRESLSWFSNPDGLVVFLVGPGNNGGDALVMARQAFIDGIDVAVVLHGAMTTDSGRQNLEIVKNLGLCVVPWPDNTSKAKALLESSEIVVDGLFGTGTRGPLREVAASITSAVNKSNSRVVSIDIPSGIGTDYRANYPTIRADATLSIGLPKISLFMPAARPFCGEILHVAIGFPPSLLEDASQAALLLSDSDIKRLMPVIPPEAHKSSRGRLAVFAGSRGSSGAAVLAASAAARSLCGLVSLFADEFVCAAAAASLVSVMVKPWNPLDDPSGHEFLNAKAYLAGPGWGFENRDAWLSALIGSSLPGVLDADGLTLLAKTGGDVDLGGTTVLTPHPGEMARLTGGDIQSVLNDPYQAGKAVAAAYNAVVVLKGHVTVITAPDGQQFVVDAMNPALGTGGSGDVLAGIISGIIGAGADPVDAACLGVLIHSRIGRDRYNSHGWFLAEDLVPDISRAFLEV